MPPAPVAGPTIAGPTAPSPLLDAARPREGASCGCPSGQRGHHHLLTEASTGRHNGGALSATVDVTNPLGLADDTAGLCAIIPDRRNSSTLFRYELSDRSLARMPLYRAVVRDMNGCEACYIRWGREAHEGSSCHAQRSGHTWACGRSVIAGAPNDARMRERPRCAERGICDDPAAVRVRRPS